MSSRHGSRNGRPQLVVVEEVQDILSARTPASQDSADCFGGEPESLDLGDFDQLLGQAMWKGPMEPANDLQCIPIGR